MTNDFTGIEGHEEDIRKATMGKKNCAITKGVLKYLNDLSIEYGYNSNLISSIFDDRAGTVTDVVDERFPLFLSMVIPHYHKQGKKTDLHYRTVWVGIMSNDHKKEVRLKVDIPATAYELLPEVPEITYMSTSEWAEWWKDNKQDIENEYVQSYSKNKEEE